MEEQLINTPTKFGYDLLRDHVVPSILGKHEADILYWAGKELARKFPTFDITEIPTFFEEAGWGKLQLVKSSKKEANYTLQIDSDIVKANLRNYQLEAGFIAEQYQKINGFLTECYALAKPSEHLVEFKLAWDKHEQTQS